MNLWKRPNFINYLPCVLDTRYPIVAGNRVIEGTAVRTIHIGTTLAKTVVPTTFVGTVVSATFLVTVLHEVLFILILIINSKYSYKLLEVSYSLVFESLAQMLDIIVYC